MLHGDGSNTRRYLFAGDAADAFDTILHRGKLGEIYNVDSSDEISNRDLAFKLLGLFGHPEEVQRQKIYFTQDRPFNDKRYAVNGDKLRNIGWEQNTMFEDGIRTTVEWYKKFGTSWWGDIDGILTPFPVIESGKIQPDDETRKMATTPVPNGNEARNSNENYQQTMNNDLLIPGPVMVAS